MLRLEQVQVNPRRQWEWVMAYSAYFDDSGSEPASAVYILAGVMLPTEWWTMVSEEWQMVLDKSPSVRYYKGSEVWSAKPEHPFHALSREERIRKVDALADVLVNYCPAAFTVKVNWSVFNKFKETHKLAGLGGDPYFYLFFNAIYLIHKYGIQHGNLSSVRFCFDNQGEIGKKVEEWYPSFRSLCPSQMSEWMEPEAKFGDEKVVLPLQAADMLAWHYRREATDSLNRNCDRVRWGFLSQFLTTSEMGEEELVAMATDLRMISQ